MTDLEPRGKPTTRLPGNRARVAKTEGPRRIKQTKVSIGPFPESALKRNVSLDSSSSDSSSTVYSLKSTSSRDKRKPNGLNSANKVGIEEEKMSSILPQLLIKRRCAWITPNSDSLYICFHDEEWGVPVHDDRRLFELLVLSGALAELSWSSILSKRGTFREIFDNFDPHSVSQFSEKKILFLKNTYASLISESKLRAVVENAKQMLKVSEEFGSFDNYCWSFVNHKPVVNGFRYARQVPVKTPKSDVMSKDLMRRGFRSIGPTIIYSFMQAAGIVNDHLSTCFRYQECNSIVKYYCKANIEETERLAKAVEKTCLLHV